MNTYVPIFRGLDARGGRKLRTDAHTRDNYSNPCCAQRVNNNNNKNVNTNKNATIIIMYISLYRNDKKNKIDLQ